MPTDNRVTVDEPLISTDVDRLIRTVAEKKRIPLNDLRSLCRIDKKTMDKWISVLEEEGYIEVEYKLGGTFINWKGGELPAQIAEKHEDAPEPVSEAPNGGHEEEYVSKSESEETLAVQSETLPQDSTTDSYSSGSFATVVEPEEPEEILSQYVARKREDPPDSLKSNILQSLDSEKTVEHTDSGDSEDDEGDSPVVLPVREVPQPPAPAISVDSRELINAYIDEINKEKLEIEKLKKERESLYRDKFSALEGRLESDIVALTDKIIQKQSKLAELKERVLELPDKVDDLEKLQEQLNRLRNESKEALARTKSKANELLDNIDESRDEVEDKVEKIESKIDEEGEQVTALEKLTSTVNDKLRRMEKVAAEVKGQAEKLNDVLSALDTDIEAAHSSKAEVDELLQSLRDSIALHGNDLESLEGELEGITKTEQWVKEYVSDYEKKIEDIESYVEKGDEELAEVREAAESLYIKKYLGELEDMTDAYNEQLEDAVNRDKDIENKMAASKSRIVDLVRESQSMIRKLREGVADAKDFATIKESLKDKTAKVKRAIAEKSLEGQKLVEESKATRKSKVSSKARSRKQVPKKKKRK